MFVRDHSLFKKKFKNLTIVQCRAHTPFRYLVSGGVSIRQLVPTWSYPIIKMAEYLFSPLNRFMGMFYSITIEK